jgi:predicted nucleic acid-binding protein
VIVLDTNVVSELMRPSASPAVQEWVAGQPSASLFTTTITQAQILYGVALLPRGRRRKLLEAAVEAMFEEDFADRVLPFDAAAAHAFAQIAVDPRRAGKPIAQLDAQIAAIARARDATIATRNVGDFEGCGLDLFDPWLGPV